MTFIWLQLMIQFIMLIGGGYGAFYFWMKWVGSETLSLSSSELEQLKGDIQRAVMDYVKDYVEGKSCVFHLSLYDLNQAFGEIGCDKFLTAFIEKHVEMDERVESFGVIEGQLVLEVKARVLNESYAKKVECWQREGQFERIDYYRRLAQSKA